MAKILFTDKGLKGLSTPPKPQQQDYFDEGVRGLGLRISYGGRRSWFVMFTSAGKRQRLSLGEFGKIEFGKLPLADARRAALIKLGEIAQGRNPAGELRAQRQAPTVAKLAEDFIEAQRRQGRKSAKNQEGMLARDALPAIGDMRARDVTRRDIKKIVRAITDRGAPVMANRVVEVIQTMFNFARLEGDYGVTENPADKFSKHRNKEQGRERWLATPELGAYWQELALAPPAAAAALRLSLLTGQRQANVLGIRCDQLSLADRVWLIPASETKTGHVHRVPLSAAAVAIIEERLAETEGDWLFPGTEGGPVKRHGMRMAHLAACARAEIAGYTIHDNRHSFARHCDLMKIPRLIWDPILGHGGGSMADLYSGHDFADQRLDCMERWADRIAVALGKNVVELKKGSGTVERAPFGDPRAIT